MARMIKPLNDVKIRNAKPQEKTYFMFDGGGLYLEITPNNSKLWRMKYRFNGKGGKLSFGKYPEVSLEKAREYRDQAKQLIANGANPSEEKKAQKQAQENATKNIFENIALEWFDQVKDNLAPKTLSNMHSRMQAEILPFIGKRPISELTAQDYLGVLKRIEARGALETTKRVKTILNQVIRYAIATGRATYNPITDLTGAIKTKKVKHMPAITEPQKVKDLLRTIDDYSGSFIVACALKMAPYVFVRPGELRSAKWEDIDFEKKEWRYMVGKTETPHIVPLAKQVIAILEELHPVTGHGTYVFPSARTSQRPMSDNAILAALRRLGIPKEEMTGHGFRAMARTLLDEELGERPDLIEHQLAHSVKDPLGRAYNRTTHLRERKRMMQRWADYLDTLKAGGKFIQFPKQA